MADLVKYATAVHVYIPITKVAVINYAVSADWTPATGDVKLVIDGAAAANITSLPTAIVTANTGTLWDFSLTSGETTGKQIVCVISDAAAKAIEDDSFKLFTYGNASAMYAFDLGTATQAVTAQITDATAAGARAVMQTTTTAELAAEPSQTVASYEQMLKYVYQRLRNLGTTVKTGTTTASRKTFKADGTTALGTAPVSDDGTTFSSGVEV